MAIVNAPLPSNIAVGTPPGLEFLQVTNILAIKQELELTEILTGYNTRNKYQILDCYGRRIYYAAEDTDCCGVCCLGSLRNWSINVFNHLGQPVITGVRSSCCGSCQNNVSVRSTTGQSFGGIRQVTNCFTSEWDIIDCYGTVVLRLGSPNCSKCCPGLTTCCTAEFPLLSLDGQKIGRVTKQFSGILKEAFTAADTFGIEFPMGLDVQIKAVLIYAAFMVDFMYYENSN